MGLCLIGADLRYLRINERLAAMNGLPAEEHLGQTVWEVIPEAARFFAPLLLRIIESGRRFSTGRSGLEPEHAARSHVEAVVKAADAHSHLVERPAERRR